MAAVDKAKKLANLDNKQVCACGHAAAWHYRSKYGTIFRSCKYPDCKCFGYHKERQSNEMASDR